MSDPVEGLVAYWDFEEGSGAQAADQTGNGETSQLSQTAGTDGRADQSRVFRHSNQKELILQLPHRC